ncbi:MAG: hypothetical protein IPM82_12005 [Saprospiraceae bacterium]|nr:hypothetical protein [Saprospiraceae bacterium]
MTFDLQSYDLLPVLYRLRDSELAEQLSGSNANEEELYGPRRRSCPLLLNRSGVGENLDQLYDDQFIETCSEWVVFYIGNLVVRGFVEFPGRSH